MNRKEKNNFKNFTEFKIYYQDKIKVKGILGFNWSLIFVLIYLPATLSLYIIKQITDYILLQALPIFLLVFIMILFIKKYFKILDIIEIKYLEYKKNHIIHDKCEVSLSGKQKKGMSSMTIKFSDMIHDNHELKEELKE